MCEHFEQSYADYAVSFIECLKHGDDFYGQPFLLLNWQKIAISQFYGTLRDEALRKYQYLYLEIPKKNGKSELAAALALFHTFADGATDGEVYACAADTANASIIFKAALSMLRQCPALMKRARIKESTREIKDKISGTVMKVLSAEAFSKHGYKPTCVIFDELHAQPNRELWDVMTFGAGSARKQPVWIVLTTAGKDPDRASIGWEIHQKARKILNYRAGDTQNGVDNPIWLPFIFGMPDDPEQCKKIDIYDETLWYKCNPSLGHTIKIETLRQEALDASQSEASERLFRWLRLNQWISVKAVGWLPLTLFDNTEKYIPHEKLFGKRCYLGLDLSSTTDLTALVALFPPQEGLCKWHTLFYPYIPTDGIAERSRRDHVDFEGWKQGKYIETTEGDCVDYDYIEMKITETAHSFAAKLLGTDQWNSRMLTQRLMEHGVVEVIEISQSMAGMSSAMKTLERLMRRGELTHEVNPCARWNFGNVRCAVDGNENIKPMKNKSTGRIDVTVAWINAMAAAMLKEKTDLNAIINSGEWSM
ncbi:MAG: terminase TerL endonuclease subunit [Hydrogenoanaerobacterium sp.]